MHDSGPLTRYCSAFLLVFGAAVCRSAPTQQALDDWLLMVRTVNTDPARERDFNDWYDRIDVPDVLKVPGFERARRGVSLDAATAPTTPTDAAGGRYVALYDIQSGAIDKTIIDMLMATWKMITVGRDTPLLKVEERIYYHRMGPPRLAHAVAASTPASCLVLERFDSPPGIAPRSFSHSYESAVRSRLGHSPDILRATRYELYRVLMFEPRTAPRYLTVYELKCTPGTEERSLADALRRRVSSQEGGVNARQAEISAYRQISEVRRSSP